MIKKEEYLDMIAELIPGDSDEDLEKIEKLTEVYPDDDELNTLRDQLKEANDRAESLEKEREKNRGRGNRGRGNRGRGNRGRRNVRRCFIQKKGG